MYTSLRPSIYSCTRWSLSSTYIARLYDFLLSEELVNADELARFFGEQCLWKEETESLGEACTAININPRVVSFFATVSLSLSLFFSFFSWWVATTRSIHETVPTNESNELVARRGSRATREKKVRHLDDASAFNPARRKTALRNAHLLPRSA